MNDETWLEELQKEVDLLVPLNSLLTKTNDGDVKCSSDTLPSDQGHDAFRDRVVKNPYLESQWQHDEWQFGWDCEEQSKPDLFDHANDKFY